MRHFWPLLAALPLLGCPSVEPEPEPADDDDDSPAADWLLTGEVRGNDGQPAAGVELSVGSDAQVTGADGMFEFAVAAGPPVQLDMTEDGSVSSTVTCSESERLWFWTFGGTPPEWPTVRFVVDEIEDPATFRLLFVLEYLDFNYLSYVGVAGSNFVETDEGWVAERTMPTAARWMVIAAEPRGDAAWSASYDGEGPLLADDELEVSLSMAPTGAGTQSWDGVLPEGVTSVAITERVEVWGVGFPLPLGSHEAGSSQDLPVYDGSLDVLEYSLTYTVASEVCDSATVSLASAPLFAGDVLHLPEPPERSEVAPRGGSVGARPELTWNVPEEAGNVYVYLYSWDAEGNFLPSWSIDARAGCGDGARWPTALDDLPPDATGYASMTVYGGEWSARCRTDF